MSLELAGVAPFKLCTNNRRCVCVCVSFCAHSTVSVTQTAHQPHRNSRSRAPLYERGLEEWKGCLVAAHKRISARRWRREKSRHEEDGGKGSLCRRLALLSCFLWATQRTFKSHSRKVSLLSAWHLTGQDDTKACRLCKLAAENKWTFFFRWGHWCHSRVWPVTYF